ncbi:AAA family ATPase, partial [Faecalibaculum rodentium]
YIQRKIANPYCPINISLGNLNKCVSSYNNTLEKLRKSIDEYNLSIQNAKTLQDNLSNINLDLAYFRIIDIYNDYISFKNDFAKLESELSHLVLEKDHIINDIDNLQSQLSNTHVATSVINRDLCTAYCDKNRLFLSSKNGKYQLHSRGIEVLPAKASLGERNVLALSYFFTLIRNDTKVDSPYSDEILVVIDDPISSFDREIRIGITSLLEIKLEEIKRGNPKSRIIIMTHDYETFCDIEKVFKVIEKTVPNSGIHCQYSLRNLNTEKCNEVPGQVYTDLLNSIYDYALNKPEYLTASIGNTIRRALEGFSTFLYKKGIDDITRDENLLSLINPESLRVYFKNKMFRLFLNNESHLQEAASSFSDMEFYERFSDDQKQTLSQDILCFLYLIQPLHIKAHLSKCPEAINQIKSWCEIRENNNFIGY